MSFNKIIVAIDRSARASLVFKQAITLANKTSASIHFFQCLEFKYNSTSALEINREITKVKQLLPDYQTIAKEEAIDVGFS